jgi:hypothetical protein
VTDSLEAEKDEIWQKFFFPLGSRTDDIQPEKCRNIALKKVKFQGYK